MKRFRFSLQAVLTLRQRQEQDAMAEYAAAVAARSLAAAQWQRARHDWEAACDEWRTSLNQPGPAEGLVRGTGYLQLLQEQQATCAHRLAHADKAVQKASWKWVQAHRRKDSVDRYQEARMADYRRQCQREEQKQLDELALRPESALLLRPEGEPTLDE